ncbi:MAG: DUF4936 family protein [Burkholderiales bacterium]
MSASIFVYYRVTGVPDSTVRGRVGAIHADVLAATGVAGRLLRRRDDPTTWMEIYEPVPDVDRFEQELDAALARHAFAALLAPGGARHTERFIAP